MNFAEIVTMTVFLLQVSFGNYIQHNTDHRLALLFFKNRDGIITLWMSKKELKDTKVRQLSKSLDPVVVLKHLKNVCSSVFSTVMATSYTFI